MTRGWPDPAPPPSQRSEGAGAEEHLIAPKPTPNAAQLVLVGLAGDSRRTVGLEVARALGRPFADSRLLPGAPADADPVDPEIGAAHRALGGTTRIVFACGVTVFDVEPAHSHDTDPDAGQVERPESELGQDVAEQLRSAWVVWIDRRSDGGDGAGSGLEVEQATDPARRRRAERWADKRVDATDRSHDQLVDQILDAWTACPGR